MRIAHYISYLLWATATSGVLASCSGAGSPITRPPANTVGSLQLRQAAAASKRHTRAAKTYMRRGAVGKPLIFVADVTDNIVDIYLQKGGNPKVGQIAGRYVSGGLATDAQANLYVTSSPPLYGPFEPPSQVLKYAPPYTKRPTVLSDADYYPGDVAVSPQGVVAVANPCNAYCSFYYGSGSVRFYAKDATQPCATIEDPGYTVSSVGFDQSGNLYVRGYQSIYDRSATFWEITGGCSATNLMALTTSNTIEAPETNGIKVDATGRIAVMTTAGPYYDNIDTYAPPVNGSLGSPVSVTPITTFPYPQNFAFSASGKDFYTAEVLAGQGYAKEYRYDVGPGSGVPIETIYVGAVGTYGVAVTPPLIP